MSDLYSKKFLYTVCSQSQKNNKKLKNFVYPVYEPEGAKKCVVYIFARAYTQVDRTAFKE